MPQIALKPAGLGVRWKSTMECAPPGTSLSGVMRGGNPSSENGPYHPRSRLSDDWQWPPMRIAPQILEDVLRTAEGWFGVNHPLDLSYWSDTGQKHRIQKRFKSVKKMQLPTIKGSLQLFQK